MGAGAEMERGEWWETLGEKGGVRETSGARLAHSRLALPAPAPVSRAVYPAVAVSVFRISRRTSAGDGAAVTARPSTRYAAPSAAADSGVVTRA